MRGIRNFALKFERGIDMKSTLKWRFLSGLAAGILLLLAATPSISQITGTDHDFSSRGWGSNQICIFCHTPHNAATGVSAPLWNHAVTTATYTLYDSSVSSTFNATPSQPGGVSKLCLSCHDGTVAIDSFGTRTGTTNMTGSANLGTNLTNDHPISFAYNAALATADGGLVTPASASSVVSGIPLFSGNLECASCHNVHSNTNGDFLRASNAASALCLRCHIK
jgi:predicted CXXCH cytochrome family protein